MVLADGEKDPIELAPVAVALMPGHYVVTTAAAARGREGFMVQLPSGETVVGAVVSVDVANGTAVLSITADIDMALIEASETEPSDGGFMVMVPEATAASLWVDDRGTQVGYVGEARTTGEGSVVLDGFGRLVGLCTKSIDGVQLVTVEALIGALERATSASSPPWMGITADVDQDGRVIVTNVGVGGPAATAGVQIGDIIAGIDGHPLADLEALRAAIGTRLAGDTIELTMTRQTVDPTPMTTPIKLSVTLGQHPSSIETESDN